MLRCTNRQIVFEEPRCTRCGACLAVCPVNALSLVHEVPAFEIQVDHDACIACLKCVKVCPAETLPDRPLSEADFESIRHITLAYAKDESVRFHASSGGVAHALARAALEKGLVDAVYGVRQNAEPPYYEGAYFTKPEEVEQMANSVYYVFPFAQGLKREIEGRPLRRLLFIGLNCQIQAAENFYRGGVELIKVAILCKQQKTLDYVRWLRRGLNQPENHPAPIRFRGDGWPGKLASGGIDFSGSFAHPFTLDWWRPSGCGLCPNPFGWESDIVLMDPWHLPVNDVKGTTLALLRTDEGERLWTCTREYFIESNLLPFDARAPQTESGTPITPADVKNCIEWELFQHNRIAAMDTCLGRERSWKKRAAYGLMDRLREWSGWMVLNFPFPKASEWLAIRLWSRSRRIILRFLR